MNQLPEKLARALEEEKATSEGSGRSKENMGKKMASVTNPQELPTGGHKRQIV